jgi:hypothetical protein
MLFSVSLCRPALFASACGSMTFPDMPLADRRRKEKSGEKERLKRVDRKAQIDYK